MYLVGVTGGIGSGKTTVAQHLVELGAVLIDADAIAREVVEPGEPALDDLVAVFGSDILQPDGALDRKALARVAFASDATREQLNRITHPRIHARIDRRITELAAHRPGTTPSADRLVVLDHPLLIETGQAARCDAVVVVLAPETERVRRVVQDRNLPEGDVWRRVRAQADDADRRAAATHVIENVGTREELLAATARLSATLHAAAADHRAPMANQDESSPR